MIDMKDGIPSSLAILSLTRIDFRTGYNLSCTKEAQKAGDFLLINTLNKFDNIVNLE